jgi:LCP family protein required for cell wall assembly
LSEETTPPPAGDDATGKDAGEKGPPPSTWAGRSRQEGEAEGDQPRGVTDELDAVEKALGEELEEGLAEFAAAEPEPEVPAEPEPEVPAEPAPEAPAEPEPSPAALKHGETVEVDTIAVGDTEAAQEAAHDALKARAAAHAAKRPTVPPAAAPPATVAPAAAEPPAPAPTPAVALDVGEPPKRGIWPRFLVGAILIIVSMATATAVSGLVLAYDLASGLGGLTGVQKYLQNTDPSKPQTFLILGYDKRPGETDKGRSDTTILLRVTQDQINLLSIPRDLKVQIPGHGVDKFNAAYTYGGPTLALRTVKQLTGLEINHVVNIGFTGFADAVNEIGCVYVDVDHHYFHSNLGLVAEAQYAEIDIPAGYQRMCGLNALSYVRYRHDDNDLVRSARQQAFLREARAQVPATTFANDYNDLSNIFTKYTTSDISGVDTVIGLGRLLFDARSAQIKELHFPGDIGGPDALYVTYSQTALRQVISQFLGETPTTSSSTTPSSGGSSGGTAKGSSGSSGKKPDKGGGGAKPPKPPPESNLVPQGSSTLVDAGSGGAEAAAEASKTKKGRKLDFPVYYPTKLPPGAIFLTNSYNGDPDNTRGFLIDGGGGQAYLGYKIVGEIPFNCECGYSYSDYFGFSGTNWRDAPILNNATEEKEINGRTYLLFFDNGRLRQVGWRTDDAAYWVENDLLETLTIDQMLGMAESMTKYVP